MKPSHVSRVASALSLAGARKPFAAFRCVSLARPVTVTLARAVSAHGWTIRQFATKPPNQTSAGAPKRQDDLEGPYIVEVTKENFDKEVNKSVRPVILDVYADW
jgi:thiol:disulfide interchange protein